jgi:hypothetical protein
VLPAELASAKLAGSAHRLFTNALFYRAFTQDLNTPLMLGRPLLRAFGRCFPAYRWPGN